MQVIVNKNDCGKFESYLIKITNLNEWDKLVNGIKIMINHQKNKSGFIRNKLANSTAENYDFYEIAKKLKASENQLKELEEMLYVILDIKEE